MDLITQIIVLLVAGFVTSFVSGLFGVGGGILRIPLFVYLLPWLGVPHTSLMHMAVGTSMALLIPTAIAASLKQYHQGNLDISFYRTWAAGILIGVLIGLLLVPYVSTEIFKIVFIVYLVGVAVYMGFAPESVVISEFPPTGPVKILLAAIVGLASTLTGTGGGGTDNLFAEGLQRAAKESHCHCVGDRSRSGRRRHYRLRMARLGCA